MLVVSSLSSRALSPFGPLPQALPPPSITVTNSVVVDGITYTRDGLLTETTPPPAAPGARVYQVFVNGTPGAVSTTYTPPTTDGSYIVIITDYESPSDANPGITTITFTFDTTPPVTPVLSLVNDNGALDDDELTNDPTLAVNASGISETTRFMLIGVNTWVTTLEALNLNSLVDGSHTVLSQRLDAAGNMSSGIAFSFTLDRTEPTVPTVTLTEDTGTPGDLITTNEALTVASETGATVQYRFANSDGTFSAWTATAPANLANGSYAVEVRQIDLAGNASDPTEISFQILRTLPTAPTVSLVNDTGQSSTDTITNDADLNLSATPAGVTVEYSINDGATWLSALPTFADGVNSLLVRHVDASGNASDPVAELNFTLDTVAPTVLTVAVASITGGTVTLDVGGEETGAVIEYSRNGTSWQTATFENLAAGNYTFYVRQTDIAGNVSAVANVQATVTNTPTQTAFDSYYRDIVGGSEAGMGDGMGGGGWF